MLAKKLGVFSLFAILLSSGSSYSDDTELYVFESSSRTGSRPKVLVIFDNSGSMGTIEQDAPGGYDPNYVQDDGTEGYPAVGNSHAYQGRMLYFTKGTGIDNTSMPVPDSPSEARRFLDAINGCHKSKAALDKYGRYTGYLREFVTKGKSGEWAEIPDNNGANIEIVDCWEDIEDADPINADGISNGFPADGLRSGKNAIAYNHDASNGDWSQAIADAKETKFGIGEPVTLYTDDYLRWNHLVQEGLLPVSPKSRLDIAKEAIKNVVISTPSVDFGLAVFNLNYPFEGDRDGGRIVSGIRTMSPDVKDALLSTVDQLPASTNTPLCETLFEAYRYLSGGPITFGHKDADYRFGSHNTYRANNPPYDTSVENGGNYISPMKICPDIAYVVYITDGVPTVDSFANNDIVALTATGEAEGDYTVYSDELLYSPSYLPALASYMYHNDMVKALDADGVDNRQNVRTFTIGFSQGAEDAAPLLAETAKRGGGRYFAAKDSLALQQALTETLTSILSIDSTFTSPSIASNNFDRTQTFNSAYFAMFLPGKGPRWSGNLKKLKVTSGGVLVDTAGENAIDDEGNIKDTACTIWSDCSSAAGGNDGNKVEQGGANAQLAKITTRKIKINSGTGGALEDFTVANVADGDKPALASYMNTTEGELENTFKWLYGFDVDNDMNMSPFSVTSPHKRRDIMGDPLHSKPLAINFGTTAVNPDIRVILGTNQGLIHMFQDKGDTLDETWAILPYELLPNVTKLRDNLHSGGHTVYGMDSSPVAYVESGDSGVTKAWVFMGMRRGGHSYYAIDITRPDAPSMMWTISADHSDFADLGQTWSEPVITKIPGHEGPVLIFGGGYDISYDATPNSSPLGRAVYIVDAKTGKRLHVFSASGSGGTRIDGLTDSIPNAVAVLDSNGDGVSDRIYATDVGGNIWRMDMPSATKSTWSAHQFAQLGGSLEFNDRRFFSEPVVVQTILNNITEVTVTEGETSTTTVTSQKIPYDAVTVGTGNRAHPTEKSVENMYFVLQDRNVVTRTFGTTEDPKPEVITLSHLYNVTTKAPETQDENIDFGEKLGWYYDFTESGEKSLSAGVVVDGKVYFTSYVPTSTATSETVCIVKGKGYIYVLDLHKGARVHLYNDIGSDEPPYPNGVPPRVEGPPGVPDTPTYFVTPGLKKEPNDPAPSTCDEGNIFLIGVGAGDRDADGSATGSINAGCGLGAKRVHYHIQE